MNHDSQSDNTPDTNTRGIGIGMIIVAMAITLGLFTFVFQDALDKQYNPNQTIHTTQATTHLTEITLTRNRSGHYVGTGAINGQKAIFLLDTGATYVAVPEYMASQLGLKKGPGIPISTANGRTTGYQTNINELDIGDIHLRNIKAVITPNLEEILLGMSALKQLEFTQRGNELTIRQYF